MKDSFEPNPDVQFHSTHIFSSHQSPLCCKNLRYYIFTQVKSGIILFPLAKWNLILNAFVWGIWYHLIFPDTYYPYPMGLPNFCYHLAIKEMAINGKIRSVSLVVYNYILPRKAGKCNNLPRCGVSSDLTEHMAHLVQAAVWTAGLDDRLTDSGPHNWSVTGKRIYPTLKTALHIIRWSTLHSYSRLFSYKVSAFYRQSYPWRAFINSE